MSEGVQLPDGSPVQIDAEKVDQEFARAMSAPVEDIPAPPKRPAVATGEAEKPPKRRGRPPKAEQPRVAKTAPAAAKDLVKADYTAEAQSLVSNAWLLSAAIPYTQPYALVIDGNSDQLVGALAEGAKHNTTIRRWVSDGGGNAWMLQLAGVGLNMGMQAWQIAKDPKLREQAAQRTQEKFKTMLKAQGIDIAEPSGSAEGSADGGNSQQG